MTVTEHPATTRFLDRDGHRLAYDDTGGTGPAILAIPGMGDRRQVYRHLTPALVAAGCRVVTMDLRGMGESSAEWAAVADYSDDAIASDVLALIDALGLTDVVLVGNSLGAAAAVLAATRSDRVRGLVLIGPFAREVPMKWWQKAAFSALLAPPWGRTAWVGYYESRMYPGPKPADLDAYTAELSRVLAEPGRMKALRALAANTHAESGAVLDAVAVPTLVVMGSADPDFPDPAAEAQVVAAATHGEVLMVEGSGHYPQADQPDVVADAMITRFGVTTAPH
jgi:pimeloyl-ACP methyl ester carboxylesterase